MKVISKIYKVVENRNKCVAEVVEDCGCGFDYLIRIIPEYKYDKEVFNKCLDICNIAIIGLDKNFIEVCIERGYLIRHENIALVIDNVIE